MKNQIDMTKGSIMKSVLLFALPICVGNILQQLYSTVDTLVIGNFCGAVSLAAVGTSSQPVEILLCVFLGLGGGVSILASQYTGKGDRESQKKLAATAISFLYASAIPLTILGQFVGPMVLRFMQVPGDVWKPANDYIRIIFLGTLGNMGYNMNAGILRGMGDSKASLLFLVISSAINILLDLWFVAGLGMDVGGAAFATSIAMYGSWLFSVIYIQRKYPEIGYTLLPRRMDRKMLYKIVSIGLPLGLNTSLYSMGHVMMQYFVNLQGSVFIAACSVGGRINGIANVAITSLSSAATTFSGQNLGAGNYVYLKKGGLRIPLVSGLITAIAGILVTIFCRPILEIFTRDEAVLALAVRYIQVVLPFTWAYAVFNGIISFVNGMGKVRFTMIVNLLMLWAVRIPCAYLITRFIDGGYVMASISVSFVFGMFCMFSYFWSKDWKRIGKLAGEQHGI
ncbi:MAG: MATE family efflux transporter [Lachnospiraceae bacterium]|nr:MATE family efflux transporter [Lachnospiraceae bacterium]